MLPTFCLKIILSAFYSKLQSLKLLSVMTAIRLDEKPDNIENLLFSSLMDGTVALPSSQNRSLGTSSDPLASSTWEEVLSGVLLVSHNVLLFYYQTHIS